MVCCINIVGKKAKSDATAVTRTCRCLIQGGAITRRFVIVSHTRCHYTLVGNFDKYWPISKILDRETYSVNLSWSRYRANLLLHYLVKCSAVTHNSQCSVFFCATVYVSHWRCDELCFNQKLFQLIDVSRISNKPGLLISRNPYDWGLGCWKATGLVR